MGLLRKTFWRFAHVVTEMERAASPCRQEVDSILYVGILPSVGPADLDSAMPPLLREGSNLGRDIKQYLNLKYMLSQEKGSTAHGSQSD